MKSKHFLCGLATIFHLKDIYLSPTALEQLLYKQSFKILSYKSVLFLLFFFYFYTHTFPKQKRH